MTIYESLKAIEEYIESVRTCHNCKSIVCLDDVYPTTCENCPSDCDSHSEPECEMPYVLFDAAFKGLERLKLAVDIKPEVD
jgi:hypothetical protein